MAGNGRRYLQGHCRRRARRPREGPVRQDDDANPLHRAADRRGRCPDPQRHLDAGARREARYRLRGAHVLRRSGVHGEQEHRRRVGEGSRRGDGVRVAGLDLGEGRGRRVQGQRAELHPGRHREQEGAQHRVLRRALRRARAVDLGVELRSRDRRAEPGRLHHSARRLRQGSDGARGAPGRSAVEGHRRVVRVRDDGGGGERRHLRQHRRDARQLGRQRRPPAGSQGRARRRARPSTTSGPTGSSSRSGTTARSSSATSDRTRR